MKKRDEKNKKQGSLFVISGSYSLKNISEKTGLKRKQKKTEKSDFVNPSRRLGTLKIQSEKKQLRIFREFSKRGKVQR